MTRRLVPRLVAFGVMLSAAATLGACAAPTEIRLRVHTNMPCTNSAQWRGVAIYAGTPGASLETKAPTLLTQQCDRNGLVGTLVIVPSGSKDAEVGVRVVGGITRAPDDCAANDYTGCIVARRQVRFNRHETLDLEVALTSECIGFGCDESRTCIAGKCEKTETVPAIPDPVPDTLPDAGSTPIEAGAPRVRCGDNGVICPTSGNLCCLTVDRAAGTTFGECRALGDCPSTSIVLACDDETDCAAFTVGDDPGVCSLAFDHSSADAFLPTSVDLAQCISHPTLTERVVDGLGLCQTREGACSNGSFPCIASEGEPDNPLPGYFWCKIR